MDEIDGLTHEYVPVRACLHHQFVILLGVAVKVLTELFWSAAWLEAK